VPGIVVLGMHRSGTSALTRVVNLLGADLGPDSDLLTEYDNPLGHWESKSLMACNDAILDAFGRSWDFPPWLEDGWEYSSRASALLPRLRDAFSPLAASKTWAWKDPRTCLTLPLWRRVLGDELCVVLVLRDPSAVVASIRRRDGIPMLYGTGLWHHYLRSAVGGAAGLPVVCLHFEDLVGAPQATIEWLVGALRMHGIELDGDVAHAKASVQDQLVHHEQSLPLVARLTSSTVQRLRSLPSSSASFAPRMWREPAWVRPLVVSYRVPWVLRTRAGHPLPQGYT
jgi:hypothetical protein